MNEMRFNRLPQLLAAALLVLTGGAARAQVVYSLAGDWSDAARGGSSGGDDECQTTFRSC